MNLGIIKSIRMHILFQVKCPKSKEQGRSKLFKMTDCKFYNVSGLEGDGER